VSTERTRVFYTVGETRIETVLSNKDNSCIYSGKTFEELQKEYPEAEMMFLFDASKEIEKAMAKRWSDPWVEITEEQWNDKLNCLPPMHWHSGFFMMSEFMEGNYTGVLAEHNFRYFEATRLADPRNYPEYRKQIVKQFNF